MTAIRNVHVELKYSGFIFKFMPAAVVVGYT